MIKKRILFISLALVLAISVGLIGCAGQQEEEEEEEEEPEAITLKIATYFGPTTDQCVMLDAFADALESESNGRLELERYWGGTLAGGPELYGAAADGSIDIVFVPLLYSKGAFPEMDVFAQPLGIPSGWVGSHAVQDVWNYYGFSSFDDTHPLFFSMSAPLVIYIDGAVDVTDDLDGLLIRTGPPNNCVLQSLGATTSSQPMPDVYDLISKGSLDGVMIGCDGYTAWNLQDVTTHCVFLYAAGGDVFITTMSNAAWNILPADLQQVINDVSADYADEVCSMWDATNKASMQVGEDAGIEFLTLSAAERDAWLAEMADCSSTWVTSMVDKGYTQSDVEAWVAYAEERVEYWIDEQIDAGISFLPGYPPS